MFEKNVENFDKHLRAYTPSDITPNKIVKGFLTNDKGEQNDYLETGHAFTFSRTREIEGNFADFMKDLLKLESTQEWIERSDINTLRNWLEEMWGSSTLDAASAFAATHIYDYVRANPDEPTDAPKLFYADQSGELKDEVSENAVVVKARRHDDGQLFYFVLRSQKQHNGIDSLSAVNFKTVEEQDVEQRKQSYNRTWNTKVMVAEQVYDCLLYTSPSPRDRG